MSTVEKRKIAADCWKRGNEAVPKENWDYAIQMYSTSVKMVPDNLMYRQSLRFTEYKKYGNNGTGAKMAGMRLMGVKGRIKKARMSKNWQDLADAAEDGLQVNPWDPQLGADLGDALRELGHLDAAVFAYEESLKVDAGNKEVNKSLAGILEEKGEYQRAVECWQRILRIEPTSGEARSKITQLDARSVMDRGGYEKAGSTNELRTSNTGPARSGSPQPADGPGMSVEADLQRAIRKDPANKDNYLKLADHYRIAGNLEQAHEQLKKAMEVSGGDLSIRELLENVELDLMNKSLTITKDQARQNPDKPELKQRAGDMAAELLKRELEVYATRVERYPQDMRIKYELALRFMRVQKWQSAIPLFQQSRSDPRVKGESLINLGKCFFYDKKPKLAINQFKAAIPEVEYDTKPDLYKDLHYSMGRLLEELQDVSGAVECFQKVLEVDYNYKDTTKRLDKLEGGGGDGPSDGSA